MKVFKKSLAHEFTPLQGGSSCGGGCSSCRSYTPPDKYHPEKAYEQAFNIWHKEVTAVFDQYSEAMAKLSKKLGDTFIEENKKIEKAMMEQFRDFSIKLIELEELEEDTEEIREKKLWLENVVKELDDILQL